MCECMHTKQASRARRSSLPVASSAGETLPGAGAGLGVRMHISFRFEHAYTICTAMLRDMLMRMTFTQAHRVS